MHLVCAKHVTTLTIDITHTMASLPLLFLSLVDACFVIKASQSILPLIQFAPKCNNAIPQHEPAYSALLCSTPTQPLSSQPVERWTRGYFSGRASTAMKICG